jgi:hypothetical protein
MCRLLNTFLCSADEVICLTVTLTKRDELPHSWIIIASVVLSVGVQTGRLCGQASFVTDSVKQLSLALQSASPADSQEFSCV